MRVTCVFVNIYENECVCLWRDASCGPSTYSLMLIDCLRAVHKVCRLLLEQFVI